MKRAKEVVEIEKAIVYYQQLRTWATDIAGLRQARKLPNPAVLGAFNDAGDEILRPLELTKAEYAAIRRYLIRNRRKWLRAEGVDV